MRLTTAAAALLFIAHIGAAQSVSWPTAGWTVSTPEAEGMDPVRLEQAAAFIDQNSPYRYSLLVVKNGRIVFERYFHGRSSTSANDVQSITKSFTSVLLGIAMDEGRIESVERKMCDFYADECAGASDPRKLDMTLRHLLTMTSGFAESSDYFYSSADWPRYIIQSPLSSAPGEVFRYNSGLSHLLSGVLTKTAGVSAFEYARTRLFEPLGINGVAWPVDARGYSTGGWGIRATPRDLAKFGLLVARRGMWDGRRIVSEAWLRESTRPQVASTNYAYHWWGSVLSGFPLGTASGYGGQVILPVPDLDLVVVMTTYSGMSYVPQSYYDEPNSIMMGYILPAIETEAPRIDEGGVVNSADYSRRLAAGSFATVFGANLALATAGWDWAMPAHGALPGGVGGVQVTIGGRTAHPSYVSPGQVNFLVPTDLPAGRHVVRVTTPRTSVTQEVDVAAVAPAFFVTYRDGRRLVAPTTVKPGDEIALWLSGLGAAVPALEAGRVLDAPRPLAQQPEVTVGGKPAQVTYAGLAYAGVWQVNVKVPSDVAAGFQTVEVRVGDAVSSDGAVVEIGR